MGNKWDKIESLLKDAITENHPCNASVMESIVEAICGIIDLLRELDDRHSKHCDQQADWILRSKYLDFETYSCTAHLSSMAAENTQFIRATDDLVYGCCYIKEA